MAVLLAVPVELHRFLLLIVQTGSGEHVPDVAGVSKPGCLTCTRYSVVAASLGIGSDFPGGFGAWEISVYITDV